jgi:hypothetical protein
MRHGNSGIGEYRNDDHIRSIEEGWKDISGKEKYERIKEHMLSIEGAAWPGFRASYERTLVQQDLLSIALATEERLPGIKRRVEKEAGAYESRIEALFNPKETLEQGKNLRIAGKVQREYRKVTEEQDLIREAERADSDPLVKRLKVNKLIRLAEHERRYRPEEFEKIRERSKELLSGSERFENYRIFKGAYEAVEGQRPAYFRGEREPTGGRKKEREGMSL